MAKKKTKISKNNIAPIKLKTKKAFADATLPLVHKYVHGNICTTDSLGTPTPRNLSPLELVVNSPEGVIPLWEQGMILRWKFDESSLSLYSDPEGLKSYIRELFAEALVLWGQATPIRFAENSSVSDFKIRVEADDNCNPSGCTLARSFFPDNGRHDLLLFPKMFTQNRKEQVDTMLHELGHVFGLRHFFAQVREAAFPFEVFGTHDAFSIMNYGDQSELTDNDKKDLSRLYRLAWSGELTSINGTRIKFVKPYHYMTE